MLHVVLPQRLDALCEARQAVPLHHVRDALGLIGDLAAGLVVDEPPLRGDLGELAAHDRLTVKGLGLLLGDGNAFRPGLAVASRRLGRGVAGDEVLDASRMAQGHVQGCGTADADTDDGSSLGNAQGIEQRDDVVSEEIDGDGAGSGVVLAAARVVAKEAVLLVRWIGEEGGNEAVPDAPFDHDAVGEDKSGCVGVGVALEAEGDVDAIGSGDERFDRRPWSRSRSRECAGELVAGFESLELLVLEDGEVSRRGAEGVVELVDSPDQRLDGAAENLLGPCGALCSEMLWSSNSILRREVVKGEMLNLVIIAVVGVGELGGDEPS